MKQAHVLVVGGLDHTLDKLDQLGIRYSMMQTLARVNEGSTARPRAMR